MALDFLPGVRINEVALGAPPIAGVGTSTAAFVGKAPKKLSFEGKVHLVTSLDQFANDYVGDATRSTALSRAVSGFFKNGGSACYIVDTGSDQPADVVKGIKLLEVLDDASIIAAPGSTDQTVYKALTDQAEALTDRFALLDPPAQKSTVDDLKKGGAVRSTLGNSKFAAFYYPRVLVAPELTGDPAPDSQTPDYVSPVGHIAGIYARTDGERGVHKAPANAGVRGVLGVEHRLIDSEQNVLNPDGVNLLRLFDGDVVVWGARTLQVDNAAAEPLFRYLSTRRLTTYVEQSLKRGLRFAVFEPNNLALRQTITRSVRGFLDGVWRDGALFGASAEEAYYVTFPPSFNRDEDRAAGKLVVEVGLRPTFPAEFVIVRIGLILQSAAST